MPKTYGWKAALFDLFMIIITGGLWFIWLVVRYVRTHE